MSSIISCWNRPEVHLKTDHELIPDLSRSTWGCGSFIIIYLRTTRWWNDNIRVCASEIFILQSLPDCAQTTFRVTEERQRIRYVSDNVRVCVQYLKPTVPSGTQKRNCYFQRLESDFISTLCAETFACCSGSVGFFGRIFFCLSVIQFILSRHVICGCLPAPACA